MEVSWHRLPPLQEMLARDETFKDAVRVSRAEPPVNPRQVMSNQSPPRAGAQHLYECKCLRLVHSHEE